MRNPFFPFLFNHRNEEQERQVALGRERVDGLLSNLIESPNGLLAPKPNTQPPALRDHIDRLVAQTPHLGWSSPLRGQRQNTPEGARPQLPSSID